MLGNLIGGLTMFDEPLQEAILDETPEFRLKSSRGQDRSVKHENYARETDKGCPRGRIYSPNTRYNMKRVRIGHRDNRRRFLDALRSRQCSGGAIRQRDRGGQHDTWPDYALLCAGYSFSRDCYSGTGIAGSRNAGGLK